MRDPPVAAARPALAETIRARQEEILARWEAAVRRLHGAPAREEPSLRDHVPELLEEIAALSRSGPGPPAGQAVPRTARQHVLHRIAEGLSLEQVLAELDLLQEALLEVYAEAGPLEPGGVRAISRGIQRSIAVAVERYTARAQQHAEEEVHFLAHASQVLAAALSREAVVEGVAELAVPRLGDFCAVVLLDAAGAAARVAALHTADPAQEELARRLCLRFQVDPAAPRGVARVLREGVPDFIPEVTQELLRQLSLPPGAAELGEVRRMRSYLAVPLRARERTLGALVLFCYRGARRYVAQDLALAEELARRGAVALDNARLYQQALAEARQRETVLAVVSHDLRNPLSAIYMAASRVRTSAAPGPEGERTRTSAETIRRAAERMKRLIDDLLDSVSIQAGRLSLRRQLEDPGALAREAAEAFQAGAREKQLAIELHLRGPPPPVRCDRDRVLQVLSNLLGNALKVTPAGGKLSLEVERRGDEVVFAVRDTGPGVAPELLPRLFEPYVRGEAGYRGTGLGLAIARGIVAAHGGRIWVDSRVGEGSTFSFALPVGGEERPLATPPPLLH